jgi:hypothetical protein
MITPVPQIQLNKIEVRPVSAEAFRRNCSGNMDMFADSQMLSAKSISLESTQKAKSKMTPSNMAPSVF